MTQVEEATAVVNESPPYSDIVAVYGTLRKGCHNNWVMGESILLGTFETTSDFEMRDMGGYPVLISGNQSVVMEVYRVIDPQTTKRINRLEGYNGPNDPNNWYERRIINTRWGEASYFAQDISKVSNRPRVASGDWTKR